ncbi:hypothetical protein B566_EDAN002100 [Ephemera danica]|nr:hypothetical protein B566_EDAN002100 [Ephemera danica]
MSATSSKQAARKRKYSAIDLEKAICAVETKKMTFNLASKKFNIPKATLSRKARHKVPPGICEPGRKPILGQECELQIYQHCLKLIQSNFKLNKSDILDMVEKIVKRDGLQCPFTFDRPGRKWYDCFMRRHPDLKQKMSEHKATERKTIVPTEEDDEDEITKELIEEWFELLHEDLSKGKQENILNEPYKIFNAVEVTFSVEQVLSGNYVNEREEKVVPNTKTVSVMFNYSASGEWAPIMSTFRAPKLSKEIQESLPPGYYATTSSSGLMQGPTFITYLKFFYQYCVQNGFLVDGDASKKVLLFVAGIKSQITLEASYFSEKHNIILYRFVPEAMDIMQPADLGVLSALEASWKLICNQNLSTGVGKISNKSFARILKLAFEAVPIDVLKKSFKDTGLYPLNVLAVKMMGNLPSETSEVSADPDQKWFNKSVELSSEALGTITVFESMLGENLLTLFTEHRNDVEWTGAVEMTALFEIWRQWRTKYEQTGVHLEPLLL